MINKCIYFFKMETVRSGWSVLVGPEPKKIVEEVRRREGKKLPRRGADIFGDGKASERIVQMLVRHFG